MNAKKMRKVMGGGGNLSAQGGGGAGGAAGKQKTADQIAIDEKKELLRLKKEIREKKALEKKLEDLENEAKLK
jgi:hypothetical protein